MYDVIIVGGSFAGLTAATLLGRARRRVVVLDTGEPRNRFAAHSHGFLSRDGASPLELLSEAKRQLAIYTTVELRTGRAIAANEVTGGFDVELEGGARLQGRKLILAYGMVDDLSVLPPGSAECWGKTLLHCPYCHGFEVGDQRLGLLLRRGDALDLARLFRDWSDDLTLFTNGAPVDALVRKSLGEIGVKVNDDTVLSLEHDNGTLKAVVTATGSVPLDALFTHAPMRFGSSIGVDMGCAVKEGMMGDYLAVDGGQETSVPGVYAAGDIARPGAFVSFAVADGATAAVAAHRALRVDPPTARS